MRAVKFRGVRANCFVSTINVVLLTGQEPQFCNHLNLVETHLKQETNGKAPAAIFQFSGCLSYFVR